MIAALEKKKENLIETIAELKTSRNDEEDGKTEQLDSISDEETYLSEIKPDCDFIIDNFDSRTEKRTAELDGLRQAKEFLSGARDDAGASMLEAKKAKFLAPVHKVFF